MKYTDGEILQAIRSGGERQVLQYLYDTCFPRIRRFVQNHAGSRDVAFDVFQDGMVVFFQYVMDGRFDSKHEIGAFLFTVCRNTWFNRAKRESRYVALPDQRDYSDESPDVVDQLISHEQQETIAGLLERLGEKCRQLLQYSVFYKLRNSEICSKMGFSSENAVKTRKYKCMQKLIDMVQEDPELKQSLAEM